VSTDDRSRWYRSAWSRGVRALAGQLLRFAVVGSLAAVFDFVSYLSLTRLVRLFRRHYLTTGFWTATVGAMLSYFFNSRWTFGERHRSVVQFIAYVSIYVGGICWQNALLWVGVEYFRWPDLAAKAAAIIVVALCWNFTLTKFVVFADTA